MSQNNKIYWNKVQMIIIAGFSPSTVQYKLKNTECLIKVKKNHCKNHVIPRVSYYVISGHYFTSYIFLYIRDISLNLMKTGIGLSKYRN